MTVPPFFIMKKHLTFAATLLCMVSCSSTPDGIDEDALAPYSLASRTLQCNTGRGLGVSSYSGSNSCLYYEFENTDDSDAMGFYQRVSEVQAHAIIRSDDEYEVEYILTFTSPDGGTVEEKYTQNNQTLTYKGTFTLQ